MRDIVLAFRNQKTQREKSEKVTKPQVAEQADQPDHLVGR